MYPKTKKSESMSDPLFFVSRFVRLKVIAIAKTVRTFLIPETLDSTPFLP
jgi:hypothetical protein